jgi:hypothetical protein
MDIDQHPNYDDTVITVVVIRLIATPTRLKHMDDVVDDAAESPSLVADDDGACSVFIESESGSESCRYYW